MEDATFSNTEFNSKNLNKTLNIKKNTIPKKFLM